VAETDTAKLDSDGTEHDATRGPRLVLDAATKRFGELTAVNEVSLSLAPGELHAIIGENGAGKSTALKMLAGHLVPTEGQVRVDDTPLEPATPAAAAACGIGMVHQHFMLVDTFTALENLVLGCEPVGGGGVLELQRARAKAERIGKETSLAVDLDRITEQLAVGERQRLEILRVLYRGARAILLDEPTAVLSPVEVEELYATLRRLAQQGATLAVVTHRLDEVVRFCDRVTVMRQGQLVLSRTLPAQGRRDPSLTEELTRAVMGGEPPSPAEPPAIPEASEPVLELEGLAVADTDGRLVLDGIDLALRAGEVVGVAGVEGNGQTELARALAGLQHLSAGVVRIDGRALHRPRAASRTLLPEPARDVARAREAGLVVVHEDRHRDEMLSGATVADNLVLGDLTAMDDEPTAVQKRFARFNVYPPDHERLGGELSGGNQQKVVMARALDRPLRALVLAQATRGVDVGTARTIHHAVAACAREGVAVLLISADLNELRSLSHRLIVLRRGSIAADLDPNVSESVIGRAMLGLGVEPADEPVARGGS